jgi:hypothetical protein
MGTNWALSRLVVAAMGVAALAACVPMVPQRQAPQLSREAEAEPTIVVMPLDVELFELTAGGVQEPQTEWTKAALKNMHAALSDAAKQYKVKLVDFQPERGTPEDQATSLELQKLYRAVGGSILVHHYIPGLQLPTKGDKFDWSLGPSVGAIARSQGAKYALFLFVRDSYASAGRVAVIVVGALLGVGIPGGAQVGFASVVDLKTGDIVWFNRLARAEGDLRTPQAAGETVKALLSDALK